MDQLLSTTQVARAIGASEASLKRWCDKGLLPCVKTAGGHRRVPLYAVIQFLRQRGHELCRPDVLGLPAACSARNGEPTRAVQRLLDGLIAGDEELCQRLALEVYLAGRSACDICDDVIAPAMQALGERWQHGEAEVYQERRACEIVRGMLFQLGLALPPPPVDGALAIGGTLTGDPYALPSAMIALALREAGWNAESYGAELPGESIAAAVRCRRPRVVWISVSWITHAEIFAAELEHVRAAAASVGAALLLGGRAITPDLRDGLRFATHGESLREGVAFAATLARPGAAPPAASG